MKTFVALLVILLSLPGLAQQIAGTGKTGPNGSIIGYNPAGPNWLYVPVDSNGYLLVDCAVGCTGGGGGTPSGPSTAVQYNNSGVFGGDATFTFNNSTHTLDFFNGNMQAQGIAVTGTNQNSGTLVMEADVCTGASPCNPAGVFYGQQVLASTGPNPLTLMNYNCSTSSTSTCGANFNYPVFVPNSVATGDKTSAIATNLNVFNNLPGLPAQYFGAFGDAYQPPDGLNTVASSTTVVFNDNPLISTAVDGGKQVWITGAGASGHAFNATIVTVIDGSTAVLSAAPSATLNNARGIYGHEDTTAVQACFQYAAINAVSCVLRPIPTPAGQDGLYGFLIGTGSLQLVPNNALESASGENIVGSSQVSGTNLFCEFNGDCITVAASAIQGTTMSNISIQEDQSQPNSRGIHLKPQPGIFGTGPFTNANFYNISVYNPAQECLWLDGGGGPGYAFNLPNQYIQFTQFWCGGPFQSHPADLIKMTGQAAQIIFENGQVNGDVWNGTSAPNYPNCMIEITELTPGQGDTPVDVKFIGYTFEVGTKGLCIGNGANNIHYDNSYVENVSSPFIVTSATENTFNGNHIANSGNIGAVYQFTSGVSPAGASVRDTQVYGGVAVPAAIATCTGNDQVDFENNWIASGVSTNTCRYSVAVTGTTQGANSCSSSATKTVTGLQPGMVITPGFSSDPTALTGWGSTGGMVFKAWPSANNTLSWSVCNPTGSSITYSSITFNVVFK
jgi:hypothetical protein